jgi:hypothetical protein
MKATILVLLSVAALWMTATAQDELIDKAIKEYIQFCRADSVRYSYWVGYDTLNCVENVSVLPDFVKAHKAAYTIWAEKHVHKPTFDEFIKWCEGQKPYHKLLSKLKKEIIQ